MLLVLNSLTRIQRGSRDRSLTLLGAAAAGWLRQRDWEIDTSQFSHTRIYADEIALGPARASRIWQAPGRWLRSPSASAGYLLLMQHEGDATITAADRRHELGPGSILVVERGTPFTLNADSAVARLEITLRAGRRGFSIPAPGEVGLSGPGHPTRSVLASVVNAALNSEIRPHTPAFNSTISAISELASAVITEAFPEPLIHATRRQAALFAAAVALIRECAGDPGLTVAHIAKELNTSSRHLQRVFAAHATTPGAALRAERRRRAEAIASLGARRDHLDTIANTAGYTSHRAMRTALKKQASGDGSASNRAARSGHTH